MKRPANRAGTAKTAVSPTAGTSERRGLLPACPLCGKRAVEWSVKCIDGPTYSCGCIDDSRPWTPDACLRSPSAMAKSPEAARRAWRDYCRAVNGGMKHDAVAALYLYGNFSAEGGAQ